MFANHGMELGGKETRALSLYPGGIGYRYLGLSVVYSVMLTDGTWNSSSSSALLTVER